MFTSAKYSYLALRLGLAAVFLWFGIDKFFHPDYWINAWITPRATSLIELVGFSTQQFIYLNGIFEILVGVSLITSLFPKFFSLLAIIFLTSVIFFVGLNEVTIRDIGLIGGLIAILLWPSERSRLF